MDDALRVLDPDNTIRSGEVDTERKASTTSSAGFAPRVCFFGHHHSRLNLDAEVAGIRCIGLNKVAMLGNLVAVELETHGRGWSLLGEWPTRP